jgi:UDP-N-acetylglucosamine acyltransferase
LKFTGENTTLEVGENTVIREFVTLARGTSARGKSVVGKNCFIMAYVHIPHDSLIGNNVILANAINMAGHVENNDWAIVGGMVGIHQFVRIGCHSFVAFGSHVTQDIPPYISAGGYPLKLQGLEHCWPKTETLMMIRLNISSRFIIIFTARNIILAMP